MHIYRFLLLVLVSLAFLVQGSALASIHTSAKQVIVIDHETGAVLFEKNADERMPTSSMSKVMTVYMVFEALKNGSLSLDDKFIVSEKAWRKGGSKMFVEVDKQVRIEDLIKGVVVQSGNDATIVLAEGLAGSEELFAAQMTERAHDIGMSNTNFVNASGWPDPNHYSTARDLATLGGAVIEKFPEYYPYFAEKEFTFNAIKQQNRNPLLYRDIGADGIKTGHTEAGGYGLIGSGIQNGRRIVMVINGLKSNADRARESAKLLDWGLKAFENITVFDAGDVIASANVSRGQSKDVGAVLQEDLTLTVPKTDRQGVQVKAVFEEPIPAPVSEGDEIGELVVEVPGQEPLTKPLYAATDIDPLGFFAAGLSKMKYLLTGSE